MTSFLCPGQRNTVMRRLPKKMMLSKSFEMSSPVPSKFWDGSPTLLPKKGRRCTFCVSHRAVEFALFLTCKKRPCRRRKKIIQILPGASLDGVLLFWWPQKTHYRRHGGRATAGRTRSPAQNRCRGKFSQQQFCCANLFNLLFFCFSPTLR